MKCAYKNRGRGQKKKNRRPKLEAIAKELINSPFIQELCRRYPIEIFPDGDGLTISIQLQIDRELIAIFNIPANSEGLVNYETVIRFVVEAFETGLEYYPES